MQEYLTDDFQKRLSIINMPRKESRYFFFRMACPLMQIRLSQLLDLGQIPKTFLHGNPHIDNYVKTFTGSAMLDFDRSRVGPYCWDIIRFFISLSLRREDEDGFLDDEVIEHFVDAYITHYMHPEIPSKQLRLLKSIEPEKWQLTTKDYLKANKKWAKKMRDHAIDPKNPQVGELLRHFIEARGKGNLLNDYRIDEVGLVAGSFGKLHYIFSLMPINADSHKDPIMLDIKEVYEEIDNKFFYSPTPHHGERMILASKIFADGLEEKLGSFTYQDKQFWGRQVPSFSAKVKKYLDVEEQVDFAYTVGSELGKGHRKGLVDPSHPEQIEKDFTDHFDKYVKIATFMTYEFDLAFEALKRQIQLNKKFRVW